MGGGGIVRSHERPDRDEDRYTASYPTKLALADATPEQIQEELAKRVRNKSVEIENKKIYDQMNDLKQQISELSKKIQPLEC